MQSTIDHHADGFPIATAAPRGLWAFCLTLATLTATTVYGARVGVNWLALVAGIGVAMLAVGRSRSERPATACYILVGYAGVLSGALAITDEPFLRLLLFIALAWIAGVLVLMQGNPFPSIKWMIAPPVALVRVLSRAMRVGQQSVESAAADPARPLLRGLALSLPIIATFFLLLSASDPTLREWRDGMAKLLGAADSFGRLACFAVTVVLLTGYLSARVEPAGRGTSARRAPPLVGATERLMVLGSVAALFALYIALQLSYLAGNPGAQVGSGITYAQAVHRGFGEITIVVTLCAVLLLTLDRYAERCRRDGLLCALGLLVLAQCLMLLWSAYGHLTAYEAAYGYTMERLYVRLWIGCLVLAVCLCGHELRIGADVARVAWRVALGALTCLVVLGYGDWNAWVIHGNANRFHDAGIRSPELESCTIRDGIPELIRVLPLLAPAPRAQSIHMLRLCLRDAHAGGDRWFEWNLARAQARTALREIDDAAP